MSDNPADSLRRELKLRVAEANEVWEAQGHNDGAPPAFIASKLITAVMAALEAARADERELLIQADSVCSLILHREFNGLSRQTKADLEFLVGKLRKATVVSPSWALDFAGQAE